MDTIVNLRVFRKKNGLTQEDVAAYLGTTKGFISQIENGKVALPEGKLYKLLDNDMGWKIDDLVKESRGGEQYERDNEDVSRVPLLPIFAQAGNLTGWSEGVKEIDCEQVISPVKDVDMAVHIYGESMYPDIPNGSVVYVKRINPRAFVEWGRAFILDTVNGPLLKYLTPGSDEEHLKCISANHDPKYAPFEVSKEDVLGIYRVVMCMAMK